MMYGETYLDNAQAYRQIQEREAYIEQEKAAGRFDVALRDVRVKRICIPHTMAWPMWSQIRSIGPTPQRRGIMACIPLR